MVVSTREMKLSDIDLIVSYFVDADIEYLKVMGADKNKLPGREQWTEKLRQDWSRSNKNKEFYYVIWTMDGQPIGHSNINNIEFGKSAKMHLHLWKKDIRRKGLGMDLLAQTLPYYFRNFELETLFCEPYAENPAPNRILRKIGFQFVRNYETVPGWINFRQRVNLYELTSQAFVSKKQEWELEN